MKFDMKVHGIKTQPKFNFRVCKSKVIAKYGNLVSDPSLKYCLTDFNEI